MKEEKFEQRLLAQRSPRLSERRERGDWGSDKYTNIQIYKYTHTIYIDGKKRVHQSPV